MKKIILIALLFCLTGCASTHIPLYIQDRKPFTRRFYTSHQQALAAVKETLADLRWAVAEEAEPQIFEVNTEKQSAHEKVLLISEIKVTRMFVVARYARMNIYIHSTGDVSEVEMRYMVVNGMPLFRPRSYGSESLAKRFFNLVDTHLKQ